MDIGDFTSSFKLLGNNDKVIKQKTSCLHMR